MVLLLQLVRRFIGAPTIEDSSEPIDYLARHGFRPGASVLIESEPKL
jgi:hypothetical protein